MTGILLGVFCIIGAFIRLEAEIAPYMLFALWFNRLLMGIMIGAPWAEGRLLKSLIRGAILGLVVSFAYFTTTEFTDTVSFLAGIIYGIIIEYVAFLAASRFQKNKWRYKY